MIFSAKVAKPDGVFLRNERVWVVQFGYQVVEIGSVHDGE